MMMICISNLKTLKKFTFEMIQNNTDIGIGIPTLHSILKMVNILIFRKSSVQELLSS